MFAVKKALCLIFSRIFFIFTLSLTIIAFILLPSVCFRLYMGKIQWLFFILDSLANMCTEGGSVPSQTAELLFKDKFHNCCFIVLAALTDRNYCLQYYYIEFNKRA